MTSETRENLIGYLLGALDEQEHQAIETAIENDESLRRELQHLKRCMEPLGPRGHEFEPPSSLVDDACRRIDEQQPALDARPYWGVGSRFRLSDLVVAGGVCCIAALLFFPVLANSKIAADVNRCQGKLYGIGRALGLYADIHDSAVPSPQTDDGRILPGLIPARLCDGGYADERIFHADNRADGPPIMPTPDQLMKAAREGDLDALVGRTGDFAYHCGYVDDDGEFHPHRMRGRSNVPIGGDAPCFKSVQWRSAHHAGRGQNILYEDMRVVWRRNCTLGDCNDHVFRNEDGLSYPGENSSDHCLVGSKSMPCVREARHGK